MSPRHGYPALALLADPVRHLGWLPVRLASTYRDRPALQILRDGERQVWTYQTFSQQVGQMATRLASMPVRRGDRVLVVGENSPEWLIAFFAIMHVGAIAVPLDAQLSDAELEGLVTHCQPVAAFAAPRLVASLAGRLGDPHRVISLQRFDLPETSLDPFPVVPDDYDMPAALIYTSGTTGQPKGVVLSHRNLLFDALRCCEVIYTVPGDNLFSVLPLHHAYAFTCTLVGMLSGVPVTLPTSLRPESLAITMRETRVTGLPAVPLLIDHLARTVSARLGFSGRLLVSLGGLTRALLGVEAARKLCEPILRQLGGLRVIVVGGAPIHARSALFFNNLGVLVLHGYGLTETSPVITLTAGSWQPGDGVGRPLRQVSVRIHEPDDEGIGEILVQGENVMRGYYGDPEQTNAVMAEGWLRTGDRGLLDVQGRLHLLGRSKSVIVLASGKNVYPEDLEIYFGASPLIAEICVIRGRDAEGSEIPCAVILPDRKALAARLGSDRPPASRREVIAEELSRLAVGLAPHKRLAGFDMVDQSLPRTTSRKIRRHLVQAAYTFESGEMIRRGDIPQSALTDELPSTELAADGAASP